LETVLAHGARPAEPGEFTKRAFLNGRIDLTQAESVIDVINAKNEYSLQSSLSQLKGAISVEISSIRKEIIHEIAFIESALDDPEHINLDSYPQSIHITVDNIIKKITNIMESFENGRFLKEGINTVIVGKPNVGKSSLLNLLVGQDRAIVTDIAGTTRDVLEEQINLNGIILNLMDTAGIRDTEDVVERIGVDRARDYAAKADLVIYVIDASSELDSDDYEIMKLLSDKQAVILLNKSDLSVKITEEDIKERINKPIISFSAKENKGLKNLEEIIAQIFFRGELKYNDEIFSVNVRQKNSLKLSLDYLSNVIKSVDDGMPEDFYSIDLMGAYEELGKIVGESVEDDLVEEIFSKFCMGK
jgi:tRNA modification GTPase